MHFWCSTSTATCCFTTGLPGGTPIEAIKKYFITWKSDDGTRAGYLNRITLEAVEQDLTAKTTYACALYAQLSFKAAAP